MVSKETPAGWLPVYRGRVASSAPVSMGAGVFTAGSVSMSGGGHMSAGMSLEDVAILEEILPEWLLDFLFTGRTPPVPVTKINFVLLPAVIPPNARAEYGETLPELLNTCVLYFDLTLSVCL